MLNFTSLDEEDIPGLHSRCIVLLLRYGDAKKKTERFFEAGSPLNFLSLMRNACGAVEESTACVTACAFSDSPFLLRHCSVSKRGYESRGDKGSHEKRVVHLNEKNFVESAT